MLDDPVLSNYWRPVVERFTGRRVPRDWVDAGSRPLIEAGQVAFVILDGSDYTRQVLYTPERATTAEWVRASFPLAISLEVTGRNRADVYATKAVPKR